MTNHWSGLKSDIVCDKRKINQPLNSTVMHKQLKQNFHNDEYPTTRRPATPNLANRQ
jgi:hypothetical protein